MGVLNMAVLSKELINMKLFNMAALHMEVLNSESLKLLNLTNGYNVAETIIKVITIILLIVGSFSDII